jgi:hypothetical protein
MFTSGQIPPATVLMAPRLTATVARALALASRNSQNRSVENKFILGIG